MYAATAFLRRYLRATPNSTRRALDAALGKQEAEILLLHLTTVSISSGVRGGSTMHPQGVTLELRGMKCHRRPFDGHQPTRHSDTHEPLRSISRPQL